MIGLVINKKETAQRADKYYVLRTLSEKLTLNVFHG
jgi:hypothetical protein